MIHAILWPAGLAIAFLTRLPVPLPKKAYQTKYLTASAAFYPLAGAFFAALAFLVMRLTSLGVPTDFVALGCIGAAYTLNRFLHFDGLCDVLDAFLTDLPPAKRLRVMKDPRCGSYALGGGALFLIAKFTALRAALGMPGASIMIPITFIWSRTAMVMLAAISQYPRPKGTGAFLIGVIGPRHVFAAVIWSVVLSVPAVISQTPGPPSAVLWMGFFTLLCPLIWRELCRHKIGGVTGDALGALNEIMELLFLVCIALRAF